MKKLSKKVSDPKLNNVTILGATGMLGRVCKLEFPKAYSPSREQFDALIDEANFSDWVINCIGAIPQKVKDTETMWKLNADFPKKIAAKAKVIQIATDCVFSGRKGNYTEISTPDPIDEYGKSKSAGESASSMKIRCSIIGPEASNASLFEWVRQQPENATINGYADHFWNGVTTNIFAKLAKGIIETNSWRNSTFHFLPKDSVSKYELVRFIAERTGRQDLKIIKYVTGLPVDRTLATIYPKENEKFWDLAGYAQIPTIEQIVHEMPI